MYFGYHALWLQGFCGVFGAPYAVIALAAALSLSKYPCILIHVVGV